MEARSFATSMTKQLLGGKDAEVALKALDAYRLLLRPDQITIFFGEKQILGWVDPKKKTEE